MPGVTKHIYNHEISDIQKMWSNQIKSIIPTLNKEYTESDIVSALKQYYPHEWKSVEIKYLYYKKKDQHITKHRGKARYSMPVPKILLKSIPLYKRIVSQEFKTKRADDFSVDQQEAAIKALWSKRKGTIEKIDNKIGKALEKTQQVTPEFLDKLIGLYERKNTSQQDRVYIMLELKKYYSPKIIQFFFKLNDTELNRQLREDAFKHLQSFNYQPRLRRQKFMQVHTKNRKKKHELRHVYPDLIYTIPFNPEELEYRINNSKEQTIKRYDYFISHSSKDREFVQKLILEENRLNKNIFCDWINDVDYLKRHLVCEATLKVIEKRLEQSNALIFVESHNSFHSVWCKYELNYFLELGKPIFTISTKSIEENNFTLTSLTEEWFKDENYKKLALLESNKISKENVS